MKRAIAAILLTMATISIVHAAAAQPSAPFRIVVHPENPAVSASRAELTRWMLKKDVRWPDGVRVEPVDQKPNSAVREAFTSEVLERDVRSVQRYWQRQVFSARNLPPTEVADDAAVLAFVRANRGSIGYVSGTTPLDGVKSLTVTDRGAARRNP